MSRFTTVVALLLAHARHQPARLLLASLAVIAASCAVVWVVSGYDALVAQFDDHASSYLGRYDVIVVAKSRPPTSGTMAMGATLAPELIDQLRADPAVAEVNPIAQSRVTVAAADAGPAEGQVMGGSKPPVYGAPPMDPTLIATNAADPPYELLEGEWFAGEESAVMSDKAAQRLGLSVGDRVLVTSLTNQVVLPLVGIVREPALTPSFGGPRGSGAGKKGRGRAKKDPPTGQRPPAERGGPPHGKAAPDRGDRPGPASRPSLPGVYGAGPASRALYVRTAVAERINGYRSRPCAVQLAFHEGTTSAKFVQRWDSRLAAATPAATAVDLAAVQAAMARSRSVSGKKTQAYSAAGMALLAALFIIFTTLSMGVTERARELAVLRAVGLTRGQVVGLIFAESLLLALIGGAGGLLAGFGLLRLAQQAQPGLFPAGVSLGYWCIILTGGSALGGSAAAALIPAWRAARVRPLDAMVPPRPRSRHRWTLLATLAGIVLASINPVAVFVLQIPAESRSWVYWFVGYPSMVVGFLMLAPAAVLVAEKCFGYVVARLLGLDPQLAATQISANLWRTIGTAVALCVGLALYISTQTWGYSMLQPFKPGDWLPDALVAFQPVGLDDAELDALQATPGVKSSECLPVAAEQAKLADFQRTSLMQHDNVILMGIEPGAAFGGADPLLDVEFVEGDAAAAVESIERGGCCLIPDQISKGLNLHLGDTLQLVPPGDDERRVAYEVAGVVSLPGWHWFTKFSGLRRHQTRTGGIVFASYPEVRRDFRLQGIEYFWFNTDGTVPPDELEAEMQAHAEKHAGKTYDSSDHGTVTAHRPTARLTATKTVNVAIGRRADSVIWGMSQLPLVTLAIASLAVVNTIVSSTRSRRWEMGVLRSQGMTRWGLVRLVLTEAILIGVAACALSLAFGLTAGWCGAGMARYGGFFGGIKAPFIVPWTSLAVGISATLGLCLLAAVWPAVATGRAEPLKLLQAGRSAM